MGLLAGSVVMMLTALWGSCLFVERCDLVEQPTTSRLVAKDEMLTKGSHLTGAIFALVAGQGLWYLTIVRISRYTHFPAHSLWRGCWTNLVGCHVPTETGVTTNNVTKWASWIVMATLLPYLVAQAPRVLGWNTEGHLFIAIAAVLALLFLCCYCLLLVGQQIL